MNNNMNKIQSNLYISDVISIEDIESWKPEQLVLINASTGCGKTYFIMHSFGKWCKEHGKKILILTNRNILKSQMINDVPEDLVDVVKILNYQFVSAQVMQTKGNESLSVLKNYDYIVCDECHYFFTDSTFNNETDIAIDEVLKAKHAVRIFLSATSVVIGQYFEQLEEEKKIAPIKKYSVLKPLQYENLYRYKNNESILTYLRMIPANEKVIMFCKSAEEAYENAKAFEGRSAFICSKYNTNDKFKKKSNDIIQKEVETTSKFSCQFLFVTTALDNGVNIIDRDVKHIICDVTDLDTIQQCIGRKRFIDENDKVNVYIKQMYKKGARCHLQKIARANVIVDDFETMNIEDFVMKYGRNIKNGAIYTQIDESGHLHYKVNQILKFKRYWDKIYYKAMILYNCSFPNVIALSRLMHIDETAWKSLEDDMDIKSLDSYISKLVGKKLFSEGKKNFIDYLQQTTIYFADKRKTLGMKTINGFFEDQNYPYYVLSFKERHRSEHYGKNYWVILAKDESEMPKKRKKHKKNES